MKLCTIDCGMDPDRTIPELALWGEDEVVLIGRAWPDDAPVAGDLVAIVAAGPEGLEAAAVGIELAPHVPKLVRKTDEVTVLPPVLFPPRIFALARNYARHAAEQGGAADREDTLPQVFIKPATTVNCHRGAIPLTPAHRFLDYEAELGVVIGTGGAGLLPEDAMDHIFGYTIVNDVSERRLHAGVEGRKTVERDAFFDWLNGKWLDGSCPMGPCVVTADEISDPHDLRITCHVNDDLRQDASTGEMIHRIPEVIAFVSSYITLLPGDVIATGTPAGVGKALGKPLQDGDEIRCTIEGIGTLVNTVCRPD